jgi:hypothetical protein
MLISGAASADAQAQAGFGGDGGIGGYSSNPSLEGKPTRISKTGNVHLRAALYMPAMVAIRKEVQVKAFAEKLVARGKKPIQAIVAVERKLLHSIHGMWRTNSMFDGSKFFAMSA